jgi:hypothetical protein
VNRRIKNPVMRIAVITSASAPSVGSMELPYPGRSAALALVGTASAAIALTEIVE